jgi:hypothetical protein
MSSMWGTDMGRFERLLIWFLCAGTRDSLLNLQHADVGSYDYGINSEHQQQHSHFMCRGFHFDHRPPTVPVSIVFITVTFKICLCSRVYDPPKVSLL